MKGLALACGIFVAALARSAHAGPAEPGCCACSLQDGDSAETAFFCASPTSQAEQDAVNDRCGAIPGASLLCSARSTDPQSAVTGDCAEQLRELGILCPEEARAPALGEAGLGAAAALLSVLGIWTLRRRATSRG